MEAQTYNTVIIGASAAGLASAACLQKRGISYLLLEQYSYTGHAWRNHYDRLHLNTEKEYSNLPYLPFPKNAPTYASKADVIEYLERYKNTFNLSPHYNQKVLSAYYNENVWNIITTTHHFIAQNIIVATGFNRKPFIPEYDGLNEFQGTVYHSSVYKNGTSFKGKNVLVVGFGSSACEISICLYEHGAYPSLSVKGPVNIIPRTAGNGRLNSLLHSFAWVSKLAPDVVDLINAPALRAKYGDYSKYNLQKLPYGPNVQIVKHKRVPVLDIGTFDLIKEGVIKIYPGIKRFLQNKVQFTDGNEQPFDAVIFGTGYSSSVSDFLPEAFKVTDKRGRPIKSGLESDIPGLFFCGFYPSPAGMLHEIGTEAKKIAAAIKRKGTVI